MNFATESYEVQSSHWPKSGQHILASFDEKTVVVYQAYRPAIAQYAVDHQRFGGEFSFGRMSWIKPNFLWMMYRSGWATKEGQERILAVRISRAGFEEILAKVVHSHFVPAIYGSEDAWRRALAESSVRLQWDPDHDPVEAPLPRRAIQLGLRGEVLREYATTWVVEIEDVTGFVESQREAAKSREYAKLQVPVECRYLPKDVSVSRKLGLSVETSITGA